MIEQPRIAHCYDPSTRAYMCEVRLHQSPDGSWPLPDNTVEAAPADVPGVHQALRLAGDGSAWELVPDFRNCPLWDTATGHSAPNTMGLGETLPPGVTHIAPPVLDRSLPVCVVWSVDRSEWMILPDFSRRMLWNKADGSPADRLSPAQALPVDTTDVAPPASRSENIYFDDASCAWVESDAPATPSV